MTFLFLIALAAAAPPKPTHFNVVTCTKAPVRVCSYDTPKSKLREQKFARLGWPTRASCQNKHGVCHVRLGPKKSTKSCAAPKMTVTKAKAGSWLRVHSEKGRLKITRHKTAPKCRE